MGKGVFVRRIEEICIIVIWKCIVVFEWIVRSFGCYEEGVRWVVNWEWIYEGVNFKLWGWI